MSRKTPEKTRQADVKAVEAALRTGHPPPGVVLPDIPGAVRVAAEARGVPRQTLNDRLRRYEQEGKGPDWSLYDIEEKISEIPDPENDSAALKDTIRSLQAELKSVRSDALTREAVRKYIFQACDEPIKPPSWLSPKEPDDESLLGVPTILLSDFHWGEVVTPSAIDGSNEYNIEIAHKRLRRVVNTAIDLLTNHLSGARYDGAVILLGGDMITGDIHEELSKTNESPVLPTILDLIGCLVWAIDRLLDEFGQIYVAAVTGNHGRNTRRPQYKERNETNFDWLVYRLLDRHYHPRDIDGNPMPGWNENIQFDIPDGPDCQFNIYGHRYLLTHGDQFRGGDGLIGPLGPLTRGRHKKASRDASLSGHWDTMVCGHFHTLMQLPHLIVNGALKGYDEYAFGNNFTWEPPAQACWVTHPERGITFQMPLYADDRQRGTDTEWISWKKKDS